MTFDEMVLINSFMNACKPTPVGTLCTALVHVQRRYLHEHMKLVQSIHPNLVRRLRIRRPDMRLPGRQRHPAVSGTTIWAVAVSARLHAVVIMLTGTETELRLRRGRGEANTPRSWGGRQLTGLDAIWEGHPLRARCAPESGCRIRVGGGWLCAASGGLP